MAEQIQVAAFEGGDTRLLYANVRSREAVLALPLSRILVKMVRVPKDNGDDPCAYALPILQAMSPYPDEALTVSCETVRESEAGLVVIAAALPESAADDIANSLDAKKLNVTRIDALALGVVRGLWGNLNVQDKARRLILLKSVDCVSIVVLDGDLPSAIRAIIGNGDLKREVMLSLLEAEDFAGPKTLGEIITVGEVDTAEIKDLAPVKTLTVGEDAGLVGVAERTLEAGSINALPASWREVLEETRFKSKMVGRLSVVGGIWALIMATLFGVPIGYGFMTDHQKSLCKAHSREYRQVADTRDKVNLVRKYSDHNRGALEIMKAISDRLPQGIELNSWNFKRDEGLKISGEASEKSQVYKFKDNVTEAEVFAEVNLVGPSSAKGGKEKFDLDCRYEAEESL